eukprot:TRINITY_DN13113_c0_g2_i2.p1 TRINITY_DN13113_c0_g2~~TRINITY_DN13113_c0_g2_i2.p1  ORF type:complete len:140 (+),score=21.22 TRINITY_DN13113_c0_g2_i2:112-531(+)
MFFRRIKPFRRLVKAKGDDFFTFAEFTSLLRQVLEEKRETMESHVQPQADVCRLDAIKFDFVGQFERLADDVASIMGRLNQTLEGSSAFSVSKSAHPTNATNKLRELYDEVSFKEASQLYAMDISIPLNGIHYEPPPEL